MYQNNCSIHYYVDEDHLYLRFEGINDREFKAKLFSLKGCVSNMKWLKNEGYWQIPKIELQAIALFAYQHFGPYSLIPIRKPSQPQQMELPFDE